MKITYKLIGITTKPSTATTQKSSIDTRLKRTNSTKLQALSTLTRSCPTLKSLTRPVCYRDVALLAQRLQKTNFWGGRNALFVINANSDIKTKARKVFENTPYFLGEIHQMRKFEIRSRKKTWWKIHFDRSDICWIQVSWLLQERHKEGGQVNIYCWKEGSWIWKS